MPIASARRDLSNGSVYGVAWVPWHGAQQIFARPSPASWAQRGQISALGLPGAPLIARRCSAIAPEHFATIGGHVGSAAGDLAWRLPSPCPWARPQPPTRHSKHATACLATRFALPSPQCPAAPSPSFLCAWAQPLLPPEAAQKLRGSFNGPPASKRMCGTQVHQLALAWRPGKVTEDAHFHGDTPAPSAVILAKSSAHKGIGRRSKICSLKSI